MIETEVALFHAGVVHKHTGPWDVLVSHLSPRRIVLLDFQTALVFRRCEWGHKFLERRGPCPKPMSPVHQWWNSGIIRKFGGWVPQSWLEAKDRDREWLFSRWIGSDQYMPLSKEFLHRMREDPILRGYGGDGDAGQPTPVEIDSGEISESDLQSCR